MLVGRLGVLLLLLACTGLGSGCAFMAKENRRLMNWTDEAVKDSFVTANTGTKIACAPVMVPTALVIFAADAAVVQPCCAIPKAGDDTYEVLWKDPQGDAFYQTLKFVPKVVATPIVFVSDWAFRCLFAVGEIKL